MKTPSIWVGVIGLGAVLLLITPFARVMFVNVPFFMAILSGAGYISGVWLMIGLREKSIAVVGVDDGLRRSTTSTRPVGASEDSSRGSIQGLAAVPSGGFTAATLNAADINLTIIPVGAIEWIGDNLVYYSPTTPVTSARSLKGLFPFFAKMADASSWLSFSVSRKTRSEARLGLYNSLTTAVTSDMLSEQERIASRGDLVDLLEQSERGEDSNYDALDRVLKAQRKRPPAEKVRKLLFGEARGSDSSESKPTQRDPR
jgi:hypothetical protein